MRARAVLLSLCFMCASDSLSLAHCTPVVFCCNVAYVSPSCPLLPCTGHIWRSSGARPAVFPRHPRVPRAHGIRLRSIRGAGAHSWEERVRHVGCSSVMWMMLPHVSRSVTHFWASLLSPVLWCSCFSCPLAITQVFFSCFEGSCVHVCERATGESLRVIKCSPRELVIASPAWLCPHICSCPLFLCAAVASTMSSSYPFGLVVDEDMGRLFVVQRNGHCVDVFV